MQIYLRTLPFEVWQQYQVNSYRPRMQEGNVWTITFECLDMVEGHWVKVRVTLVIWAFWTVGH